MKIDGYEKFKRDLLEGRRYFWSEESSAFLEWLYASAEEKGLFQTIDKGFPFYRARRGAVLGIDEDHIWYKTYNLSDFIPRKEHTAEGGRVHSSNIPALYVSTSPLTAVAETRSGVNEDVSVACIKANKNFKVLNLSFVHKLPDVIVCARSLIIEGDSYFEAPAEDEVENYIWNQVAFDFSRPIYREKEALGYLPCQVISEYFLSKNVEAIAFASQFDARLADTKETHPETRFPIYSSSQVHKEDHYNIAIFDVSHESYELVRTDVYRQRGQIHLIEMENSVPCYPETEKNN